MLPPSASHLLARRHTTTIDAHHRLTQTFTHFYQYLGILIMRCRFHNSSCSLRGVA